jgi:hypothetical protein
MEAQPGLQAVVAVFFGNTEVSCEPSNSSKLNVRRYFPGVKWKHSVRELYFSGFLAGFSASVALQSTTLTHPEEAPQRRLEGRTMLLQSVVCNSRLALPYCVLRDAAKAAPQDEEICVWHDNPQLIH